MPCRPRMKGCAAACLHRQMVDDYQAARRADLDRLEAATALYPAEVDTYLREKPPITFKAWLTGGAGRRVIDRQVAA